MPSESKVCYDCWLETEEYEFNAAADDGSKALLKYKIHPESFYDIEWQYGDKLVCSYGKAIKSFGDSVEIEVDKLSSPALCCDALLIFLTELPTEDTREEIAGSLVSKSHQLITEEEEGNNNKINKSFLISIEIEVRIVIYLDDNDMNAVEEYKRTELTKKRPVLRALVHTRTFDCNSIIDFVEDDERCAICFEDYLMMMISSSSSSSGSESESGMMIYIRCSFELGLYENMRRGSSNNNKHDIMQLPCSHQFHANCIIRWFKKSKSCPLCRFEIPSIDTLAAILELFYSL